MIEGLPALRQALDSAFAAFRRDPSLANARRLHEAIRVYGGTVQGISEHVHTDQSATTTLQEG